MLSVRLYGAVGVFADGVEVPMGSLKQRAVLALLALEAGRVVSVDRLLDELWPDTPPTTAISTLQVYLSRLRRLFGDDAAVLRRRPGYALEMSADRIDVHRAVRLLDAGRAALQAGDATAALAALTTAGELTSAPALLNLRDQAGPVVEREVGHLTDIDLSVRELHVEALLATGQAAPAVDRSRALIAAAPLRENAHVLLMHALYRSGRQAEALGAFDKVRRLLAEELGADPGPALRRLHGQILQHDPSIEDAAGGGSATLAEHDDGIVLGSPSAPPATGITPTVATTPTVAIAGRVAGAAGLEPDGGLLVGRDATLQQLQVALDAASAGHGSLWVVEGEAGVGKTTLAGAVARHASAIGFDVAWGRADEAALDVPYWVWQQLLRALPDLPGEGGIAALAGFPAPSKPPPAGWLPLVAAVADRLAAVPSATLLVVDDVQWADDASLALLVELGERAGLARLVVMCTHRTDATDSRLLPFFSRLARTGVGRRVELVGLAPADLPAMIGAAVPPDVLAAVHERTNGNPFFVAELVKAATTADGLDVATLATALPGSVRDVVLARCAALPSGTRRLLDTAAVAAPTGDLGVVEAVARLDDAIFDNALDAAVRAGLLVEHMTTHPVVRFGHSLIREVMLAQLRPSARARLHAAVAMELLARPVADGADSDLVHHLLNGSAYLEPSVVVSALVTAATTGLYRFSIDTVERLLRRALQVLAATPQSPTSPGQELAVQLMFGRTVAARIGWPAAEAQAAFARAADLAVAALAVGEPVDELCLTAVAYVATALAIPGESSSLAVLADRLQPHADDVALGRLLDFILGCRCLVDGAAEAAVPLLRAALDHEKSDARWSLLLRTFGRAYLGLALSAAPDGAGAALAVAAEAVEVGTGESPQDRGAMLTWRAVIAAAVGDHAIAEADAAEALELTRAGGMAVYESFAGVVHGWAQATAAMTEVDAGAALAARVAAVDRVIAAHARYRAAGRHAIDPLMDRLKAESLLAAGRSN
ncbi:BTAD domain-containing putative transcriptional regulator [uncultured Jatrophihabitans sp.]|uniref:BTAD domain-containing putative transcriptional regulator n=1 Tax=uncultured Jatrophihabitans sp. TaxID=1610747 RepID=UPI0035C9CADD